MNKNKNNEVEEIKDQSDSIIIFQKEEFESKLNDIKYLKDQEHISLKNRIRKLEDELSLIKETQNENFLSQLDESEENDKVKVLNVRLSEINDKIHEELMSHERIILSLQKENEELLNKNRSLKATIEKMKTELRLKITEKDTEYTILKQKYRDKWLEVENSSNNNREILKLKKKISYLKLKISRFENERRDMKDVIKQKDIEIDIERAAKKKAQISEKKIAKEWEDKIITMKTEISHKINKVNQNKKILENSEKKDARYESPKANQKVSKKTCDIIFSEKDSSDIKRK